MHKYDVGNPVMYDVTRKNLYLPSALFVCDSQEYKATFILVLSAHNSHRLRINFHLFYDHQEIVHHALLQ
jgi:hypothetical protein